ncbi:hypothetical protein ACWC9T_20275, partial [Kitasatospora sp. NPDC001159]
MTDTQQVATANRLLAHDTFDNKCALRPIMDQTTSRWATLIISLTSAVGGHSGGSEAGLELRKRRERDREGVCP